MKNGQIYRVRLELEVTAHSKEEALQYFIEDVIECFKNQTLDAEIHCLSEDELIPVNDIDFERLEVFLHRSHTETIVDFILRQKHPRLEVAIAWGAPNELYHALSEDERRRLLWKAIQQMPADDLFELCLKHLNKN